MSDQIYKTDSLISEDIDAYLKQHHRKDLLRFITCSSVDDGKSTLIGRLLYDSKIDEKTPKLTRLLAMFSQSLDQ